MAEDIPGSGTWVGTDPAADAAADSEIAAGGGAKPCATLNCFDRLSPPWLELEAVVFRFLEAIDWALGVELSIV